MKIGVNTFIWAAEYGQEIEAMLPTIKAHGFDGVEVSLFRAQAFPAKRIRNAATANGLECNVCSALVDGLSLISADGDVRARTIRHIEDLIRAAAEAGASVLAGPMYSPVGFLPGRRRTADEWNWAVEGYQQLGDTLASCNITLAIEPLNRFETYFLNTAEDAASLASQVNHPNIGILFDTFHANIEEKNIANGYRTVGRHLKHVHISENDRGTPGRGHVEWNEVFRALGEIGYNEWLTIESFGFALGDISAAASIWRDIEKTPGDIAFDGIAFLNRNVQR